MSDPRPVTIVIPSYNQLHLLPACLDAIRRHTRHPDTQIAIVDLGSTDGSRDFLDHLEGIQVIHHSDRSAVGGLNRAFAQAHGRDVVRLHPSVVVETDGWLRRLIESSQRLPRAGAIGVKLVFPDGRLHSFGRSIIDGTGIWERHASRRAYEVDSSKLRDPEEVDTVHGALAYYRREMLNATGGLDERFSPAGLDADDLCLMARHAGYKIYVDPQVTAVHYEPGWSPTTHSWIGHPQRLDHKAVTLKRAVLDSQAAPFEEKWGFDPRFPDLCEIRRLYGHTEICWRVGEAMRFQAKEWPPSVDVVMVTWNNRETLQRCLESLAQTRYPRLTLHITDNGSRDDTLEYLQSLTSSFPFPMKVYALPVNTGVAVGMNWSIVHGDAELVARLDDDVELPPEWLEVMVEDFRRRPFAGVVGPRIVNDSTTHDIQCGGYRMFPGLYGHDGEPDLGQADYLARCVHVRGCCNVYRRDVLEDCGLFDLRFSPSQADDPDHHIALAVRGYEILYEGRVRVIHSLTNGAQRTHAAMSNQRSNVEKMYGKWGHDIYSILDQGIELSQEGRFLPDDGDTSHFLSTLPPADSYPRLDWQPGPDAMAKQSRVLEFHDLVFKPGGELQNHLNDILDLARFRTRDGNVNHAVQIVHTVVDLQPFNVEALRELGDAYQRLGQPERAQLIWRRALQLLPSEGRSELEDRLAGRHEISQPILPSLGSASRGGPADRSALIGQSDESSSRVEVADGSLRVLMVNTFEPRVPGGDMVQIKKTREHLQRLGVHVDVSYAARPDPKGYDLIHVFNLWFPHQTLPQVKAIRVQAPDIPIVLSPIYWDMSEKTWAEQVVPSTIEGARTRADLDRRLALIAKGLVPLNGKTRDEIREPEFFRKYQREILARVDHLLPLSNREMGVMHRALGETPDYTVVRNAAEPDVFVNSSPDWFEQEYGIKDFVVCVGLIEARKNQLLLMQALQGLGVPAVVIGRNYDRAYLRYCQDLAPKDTIFIEHLPHDRLASALKAARVFCLPSWMECASLANIEAALSGCGLALSDRASEQEYFEDCAYYCDPGDVESIREAIVRAYTSYDADAPKREILRRRFTQEWTWEQAARDTLAGYEKALEARRGVALAGPLASS